MHTDFSFKLSEKRALVEVSWSCEQAVSGEVVSVSANSRRRLPAAYHQRADSTDRSVTAKVQDAKRRATGCVPFRVGTTDTTQVRFDPGSKLQSIYRQRDNEHP